MAENAYHNPRPSQQHSMRFSILLAPLALISASVGLILSMHYPLAPNVMTFVMLLFLVAQVAYPNLWLLTLPALLPVVGFAPWTGWITFEELDILILAVAAGGYARLAWPGRGGGVQSRAVGGWLLAGLFALATAVSIYRGFVDADGFSFGWFQGYHEPMNSVRVGKSFFLALLLVPLWQVACKQDAERSQRLLSLGLMLGLAAVALTTVWERAAFVDLLNFSADYRTTGMFWEMHVGGAALDGFLALTVPFAVRELVVARTPLRWGAAAAVLGLGAYACLTTFSRGVYLAVPVGLLVFVVLNGGPGLPRVARIDATESRSDNPIAGWAAGICLVSGFGAGAAWMFRTSGYRGMLALLGTVALMLPLARVLRAFKLKRLMLGGAPGLTFVLLVGSIAWLVPKGAYVAWGLAAFVTVTMLVLLRRSAHLSVRIAPMALAGFCATLASTAMVAAHWGDAAGLTHALPVLLAVLCLSVLAGARQQPLWPVSLRWQASTVGAMSLIAASLGVMGGGTYMGNRFSTGGQDLEARLAHWQLGRSMLATPADWWLGKGLGRFAVNYFLNGNPQQRPGDYRVVVDGNDTHLILTGGMQVGAEMFRVSQRVATPGKNAAVTARVQAESDVVLLFEVCEKHLIYSAGCMAKQARVKGAPGIWQDLRVELQGSGVNTGAWYVPRMLAFSMGVATLGGKIKLDDVALVSVDGLQLLNNGNFSAGMTSWFFSSDRNHLPWHIKSLFMNELFDQGLVGLTLWLLLFVLALWRLSFGPARTHPLAPALAAALVGFAVVGLFDSLLDVPRLAWLFYFLLLAALTLPPLQAQRSTP